jgi:hypothetical protein
MNREQLIESTIGLGSISAYSLREFKENREILVAMMNSLMAGKPELDDLIGEANLSMMKENHVNHAKFMESVFALFDKVVLVDTILWVFRTYRSRAFKDAYWIEQLNSWIELYRATLSQKCLSEILPFYHWMLNHISDFSLLSDEISESETHKKE